MACLFCGKEIGPFRVLRDSEFCCPAHRKGYSARLGKALGRISAHEPPPAPIATFIPYKPFPGNNRSLSQVSTLEPFRPEIQLLSAWPLAVTPLPRERMAPLPLQPFPLQGADFSAQPQPWPGDRSLRHLSLELLAENPLSGYKPDDEPEAAGPAFTELSAADRLPKATVELDPSWTAPAVRLPDASRPAVRAGALVLCPATRGLLADAVEAFIPPSRDPQMLAYSAPCWVPVRWPLQPVDWKVSVDVASPAAAPAAEPVEALLPAFAEPQSVSWPAAPALPQLAIDAADWLAATAMAEPVTGPPAVAVEALLPAFAEPQSVSWPAAPALPQLAIDAADWLAATAMAEPVAGPPAVAVEALLPAFAEPLNVAWPAAPALPQLKIEAADMLAATAMAEPAAGPIAQPVESFLPSPAEPQISPWPAVASALPRMTVNPAGWVLSVDVAGPMPAAAAEAVESFLPAPAEPQIMAWPAAAAALPRLTLDPAAWVLSVDLMESAAAASAEPVEAFLPPFAEPQIVSWPAAAALLPRLSLEAADWVLTAGIAKAASSPAAEAVESLFPAAPEPCALPIFQQALRLPQFTLAAIEPEPLEEFVPPLVIANACQDWMPSPPACETVRDVIPSFGGALPSGVSLQVPVDLSLQEAAIRWEGDWRPAAMAEPVISFVAPHLELALSGSLPVSAPETGALQRAAAGQQKSLAAPAGERLPEVIGPLSDSPVAAAAYQQSGRGLRLPDFVLQHATGNRAAPFRPAAPAALQPATAEPNPGSDATRLDTAAAMQSPAAPAALLRCGFPLAKAIVADFICQRTPMAPVKSLESIAPKVAVLAPKFVVRPIFERVEEAVEPPKQVERIPAFAEIFEISKAMRKQSATRRGLFSAGKLIAASLIVGLGMWFGAGSVKISRQLFALNTNIHGMGSNNTSSGVDAGSSASGTFPSPKYSAAKAPEGPIARVRHAIQSRASVELTDTFRRMEAWGSNALTLPAGWTRNSDGYVRTGQLALYRPTQSFADYHFEFFGEIEKKSMSWAVRAHDPQNYYGMKMTVIEPGLRPVVAMVHYAVVGGKKGQRVETPLSIMVHNNEPYHIAVDVKGNKVITSIEGQEVDSWTDDAIKVGGIGFFSEVGESARLYWMRVSKNQDWLGRVCAYLSSGSRNDTADLWREETPHAPSQPSQPALPPTTDVTLAAAEETEEFSHISPQRARISKYGRTELCRS